MTESSSKPAAALPGSPRLLPVLLVLFVGSGCAALIYEIVWFQLLQLVISSSAVSLGVLLGTFMGGMCLGSLALPRLISPRRHPLRVYALLELGIGVIGLLELLLMPYIGGLYVASVGHGMPGLLLRGVVCAVCLLPPTLLMGATLPAIARWVEATPQGVSWLGFFYGGNIAGAVFGSLLAGFYLLRVYDMATATYVAAAINATVALIGLGLAAVTQRSAPAVERRPEDAQGAPGSKVVYVAIALSGMTALGAEVVWTRLLSLLLGATVYTFSIILAVFLVGLGIGSGVGSFLARGKGRPRLALGVCQLLLVVAIAWTAWTVARSLPYWPINPALSKNPWINFQLDLVRCLWAILPAAVLWGASFPLALAAVAARGQDAGRLVGGVYAANTVGAIVGAIGFSLLGIPCLGTRGAQQVMMGLACLSSLFVFIPLLREETSPASSLNEAAAPVFHRRAALGLIAGLGWVALLIWSVPLVPWGLIGYGRQLPQWENPGKPLYVGEGMNSSVVVSELATGARNFHVSGKVEASTEPQDMRLQRMLGHIPALLHPKPRSVLIVGCGAGVTAGTFVLHPSVQRIVICEIEPLIPQVVAHYFALANYEVVKDPRVQIVYDDARHYVLTTREKFDIITSDPIHPWVKGAATLYTKEYFEMVKRHLNPGGVVTQWVPLYESTPAVVKSEVATFFDVFPHGSVWGNTDSGKGYDTVLLGQVEAMDINAAALQARLDRGDHMTVSASLFEVGFKSVPDLLATYTGQGADLAPWTKGAEINRDRNLRLQYLAGMGLNSFESATIYDEMLTHCKRGAKTLTGPPPRPASR